MIGLFQFGIKKCQQFLPGIIGLNLAIAVRVYEILKAMTGTVILMKNMFNPHRIKGFIQIINIIG